jgi:hypothetical protein
VRRAAAARDTPEALEPTCRGSQVALAAVVLNGTGRRSPGLQLLSPASTCCKGARFWGRILRGCAAHMAAPAPPPRLPFCCCFWPGWMQHGLPARLPVCCCGPVSTWHRCGLIIRSHPAGERLARMAGCRLVWQNEAGLGQSKEIVKICLHPSHLPRRHVIMDAWLQCCSRKHVRQHCCRWGSAPASLGGCQIVGKPGNPETLLH